MCVLLPPQCEFDRLPSPILPETAGKLFFPVDSTPCEITRLGERPQTHKLSKRPGTQSAAENGKQSKPDSAVQKSAPRGHKTDSSKFDACRSGLSAEQNQACGKSQATVP